MSAALVQGRPAALGLDPARLERIDAVLARHVADGGITGAVYAFARDGKLARAGVAGFADPLAKTPMRADALFQCYPRPRS